MMVILAPVEDVDEGEIGDGGKEHWHRSIVQGRTKACAPDGGNLLW